MSFSYADDLTATVRYALETTRALAACPFHPEVMIRVGDDAAETRAFERAKRVIKSDGDLEARRSFRGAWPPACGSRRPRLSSMHGSD